MVLLKEHKSEMTLNNILVHPQISECPLQPSSEKLPPGADKNKGNRRGKGGFALETPPRGVGYHLKIRDGVQPLRSNTGCVKRQPGHLMLPVALWGVKGRQQAGGEEKFPHCIYIERVLHPSLYKSRWLVNIHQPLTGL